MNWGSVIRASHVVETDLKRHRDLEGSLESMLNMISVGRSGKPFSSIESVAYFLELSFGLCFEEGDCKRSGKPCSSIQSVECFLELSFGLRFEEGDCKQKYADKEV